MARTILLDSTLPRFFWSYAFIWAEHTLNRIPNKASGKVTPLEAFLKHKPQFGIFRLFGSIGYAHIPVEVRKKLDERAHHGHVVAYLGVSKGWQLHHRSINFGPARKGSVGESTGLACVRDDLDALYLTGWVHQGWSVVRVT
jgi:hypothetical protein